MQRGRSHALGVNKKLLKYFPFDALRKNLKQQEVLHLNGFPGGVKNIHIDKGLNGMNPCCSKILAANFVADVVSINRELNRRNSSNNIDIFMMSLYSKDIFLRLSLCVEFVKRELNKRKRKLRQMRFNCC